MAENSCVFDLGFDLNLIPETENLEVRSDKLGGANLEINDAENHNEDKDTPGTFDDAENHDEDKDGKEIDTPGICCGFDRGFDLNLTPEVNLITEVENTDSKPKKKRGRKRKRVDVQNVDVNKDAEKRVIRTRGKALVGRYVRKEFVGSGVLLGKIVFYDSGLYRIDYEDGDYQDLELSRVKSILIQETDINGEWLERKKKLDELVSSPGSKVKGDLKVEEMTPSIIADVAVNFKVENGAPEDSARASGNDRVQVTGTEASLEGEVPPIPQPKLPFSSGTIGIPEEYVSHLFSVYSFLRSFSIQLFLSPFTLDDFVGSLNCAVPNALLDSVHVALMRALRRHMEKLSTEGSEFASKCMRGVDWSLLDTLTWPVYLLHYLSTMGCADGPEWKGFYTHVLKEDYYTMTVGRKLAILQILCDDVLDTKEFRAEVDMREELEVGMDSETSVVATPVNRPKRVHPRKSKTSACKDHRMSDFIGQSHEMKSFYNSERLISKDHGQDSSSDVEDSNGDECLLCGMDGILLCCDGCPASYHARCIGICKVLMPEGAWYCPECTLKTTEPKVTRGTSLNGLDVLGFDAYGQAFVATCGHLLVLSASMNSESCFRYYNQADIPNVLQALQSNEQHASIYSELCKAIINYWELPAEAFSCCGTSVVGELKEVTKSAPALSLNLLGTEGHSISEMTESEETLSCVTGSSLGTMIHATNTVLNTASNLDHAGLSVNGAIEGHGVAPLKPLVPREIQVKSSTSSGPLSEHIDPLAFKEKEKSSIAIPISTSRNISENAKDHLNGSIVTMEATRHKETNDGHNRNLASSFLYMGSSFKSQGYINNYLHGDFAASAAANVNSLSSVENLVSETQASDLRKLISASYSLQMKAFSSVASRFFWPHTEKKLIEIPRERCTWCLSCKAPVASKRGCLLNAAASNAIKNATKILAGLRPLKSGDGTLLSISTYIMLMEESLSGLTFGPFQAASFRKRWRRQLEQANTLSALKTFLLEFEENIRPIALSGDWLKLVDGWPAESSAIQNSVAAVASTQKRKPGKRSRKVSITTTEVNTRGGRDTSADFTWWRGSMLSKLLFRKGSLPRSLVKKAARQGGSRKMPGTYYAEGSETPKISRQLVWRAAVEMSKNLSQLALQVRYLDFHIRWNDLVRPEMSVQDTKAFRNALVTNKKIVENETRYSIGFGSQKHPPSRFVKNITEVEKCHNGEKMYWLPETRIPLYLIKEYEASVKRVGVPSSAKKPANAVAKLQNRQLKASRKDIFSYLARKSNEKNNSRQKRDKTEKNHLSVCRLEVLLGVCEVKNVRKTRLLTRRRSAVKCWCTVCLGTNLKKRRQVRKRRSEKSLKKNGTSRRSKVATAATATSSRSKSKRKR